MLQIQSIVVPVLSVVDPYTLSLDPDPEFWLNLDPDPGFCYTIFIEKNFKIFFEKRFPYKFFFN